MREQLAEKDRHISELTEMIRVTNKIDFASATKNDQLLLENQELKIENGGNSGSEV
ncbi:hypothetical protein [Enterococcus faecium]|uniref:hypothetical protein n=1 Tax=Enterococcus faecium TaxID=1352 RepID=UPI001D01844F|nr:hypothetical protein [Enterococcus faecium]